MIFYVQAGNVYIVSASANRVVSVRASSGVMRTVAGVRGQSGYNGDAIPATTAYLKSPYAVCVDSAGNVFIADSGNYRIRKVVNGIIYTIAGTSTNAAYPDGNFATASSLYSATDLTLDSKNNLYFAETGNNKIRVVNAVSGLYTNSYSYLRCYCFLLHYFLQ